MPADNTGQTIKRTLLVLRSISLFQGKWFSATELADQTGFALSTTHRYIQVFVEEGILEANEIVPGKYRHKRREVQK